MQESNIIDSPGLYEANHQLILALIGAQAHSAAELSNLVVKTSASGAPIRVADIATVEPSTMPVYTAVTADGKPAVLLNIARQPSGNTVAVARGVAAEIDQLQSKLPPGVHLKAFYDQSELVRESILSVRDAILIGLVLACIILFLFLHDWTSSLVAGLVIPVTVAVTILFLWITGQSFNLMTLGGLAAAIGLVIDDAIVVVENIAVHREAGDSRIDAVRKAIREISRAAGLLHHYPGHRLPAADLRHRRHRQLLPRAGRHHDGSSFDLTAARAYFHARPLAQACRQTPLGGCSRRTSGEAKQSLL